MSEQTPDPRHQDVTARDLRNHTEKYAQLTLKAAFIINGGAAVAVLTFIGSVALRVFEADKIVSLADLTCSLVYFSAGVLLCAVSTFLAYWAEYMFYSLKQKQNDQTSSIFTSTQLYWSAKTFSWTSSLCILVSYCVFVGGVFAFESSLGKFAQAYSVPSYKSSFIPG
ncbi:MAG: hypothetical protein OXH63_06585 [Gemmatimonadetes bacterium]|nr:hypothetical protein [Gemmatimonadota bacterium]